MTKHRSSVLKSAFICLVFGLIPKTSLAANLSEYRAFQLGADLPAVAKLAGTTPSQAKTINLRPALIQDLAWRPQSHGSSPQTEPVREVTFSFYDGALFRIVVDYDRYETEGMTADDFVDAISATYGTASKPTPAPVATSGIYGNQEAVLAQWQDPDYRFDLIRSSYGPTFKLVGVLKRLEAPVLAATLEAKRLDDQEAPQRDAARLVSEEAAAKAKLERARLVNKPKFRP